MDELVTNDNLFVGEVCHIEAAQPGGPRFNRSSDDDARRSFDNLILLCHPHHRRIDSDVDRYSVDELREMKAVHESGFLRDQFKVDESVVYEVEREMREYWADVRRRQREHIVPDLAVRLEADAAGIEVFRQLDDAIRRLEELVGSFAKSDEWIGEELSKFLEDIGYNLDLIQGVPYYENPFELRNWELHHIGAPNALLDCKTLVLQAEVHYLSAYVKLHPTDVQAQARLGEVKDSLAKIAGSHGYVD
jgi:hypothetical protein